MKVSSPRLYESFGVVKKLLECRHASQTYIFLKCIAFPQVVFTCPENYAHFLREQQREDTF